MSMPTANDTENSKIEAILSLLSIADLKRNISEQDYCHNLERNYKTLVTNNEPVDNNVDIVFGSKEEKLKGNVVELEETIHIEKRITAGFKLTTGRGLSDEEILILNGNPYMVVPIEPDSSSLFSCLSYFICGKFSKSLEIREKIDQFVVTNLDRFQLTSTMKGSSISASAQENLNNMWGERTTFELEAAAEVYLYRLEVWTNEDIYHIFGDDRHEVKSLRFKKESVVGHFDVLMPVPSTLSKSYHSIQTSNLRLEWDQKTNSEKSSGTLNKRIKVTTRRTDNRRLKDKVNEQLEKCKMRKAESRLGESDEQRSRRKAEQRSQETDQEQSQRLAKNRQKVAQRRSTETEEERRIRLDRNRKRMAVRRSQETVEERSRKLAENRQRMAERRSTERYDNRIKAYLRKIKKEFLEADN